LEAAEVDLLRDCLDKQVVDRHGQNMGRVDGLVIQLEPGKQPRVAFVELGVETLAQRVSSSFARLVKRVSRSLGSDQEARYRIPWSKVVAAGIELVADVEAEKTPALRLELWLRKNIVSRIPGA
jgi:sporulation protein YlmC with PRC-barrel domain